MKTARTCSDGTDFRGEKIAMKQFAMVHQLLERRPIILLTTMHSHARGLYEPLRWKGHALLRAISILRSETPVARNIGLH